MVCGSHFQVSGDHILNFKNWKSRDCELNMWPLCFQDHREKHDIGLTKFAEKYQLAYELKRRGFYYCDASNKWRHQAF